jgi:hypothetical protein
MLGSRRILSVLMLLWASSSVACVYDWSAIDENDAGPKNQLDSSSELHRDAAGAAVLAMDATIGKLPPQFPDGSAPLPDGSSAPDPIEEPDALAACDGCVEPFPMPGTDAAPRPPDSGTSSADSAAIADSAAPAAGCSSGAAGMQCDNGLLGQCRRTGVLVCQASALRCSAPTADPVAETCDGLDNDCDGETDEAEAIDATVWYPDCDADGFAPSGAQSVRRCTKPAAPSTACKAWTDRSPASSGTTDCNDVSVPHHPGASYDFPFTPATAPSAPAAYDFNCDGVPEIDPDRYVAFDLEGAGQRSVLGMCGSGTGCCIYGLSIVVSQCGAGGSADIDCGNFRAEQYPVMYRCR